MNIPFLRLRVLANTETQLSAKNQSNQVVQKQLGGQKDTVQNLLKDSFERSKDMIRDL